MKRNEVTLISWKWANTAVTGCLLYCPVQCVVCLCGGLPAGMVLSLPSPWSFQSRSLCQPGWWGECRLSDSARLPQRHPADHKDRKGEQHISNGSDLAKKNKNTHLSSLGWSQSSWQCWAQTTLQLEGHKFGPSYSQPVQEWCSYWPNEKNSGSPLPEVEKKQNKTAFVTDEWTSRSGVYSLSGLKECAKSWGLICRWIGSGAWCWQTCLWSSPRRFPCEHRMSWTPAVSSWLMGSLKWNVNTFEICFVINKQQQREWEITRLWEICIVVRCRREDIYQGYCSHVFGLNQDCGYRRWLCLPVYFILVSALYLLICKNLNTSQVWFTKVIFI